MKNLWKTRRNNLEKKVSTQTNFKFILENMKEEAPKILTEENFKERLKLHKETKTPKTGDIVTLEDDYIINTIIYAGIILNNNIVTKDYKINLMSTNDFIEKYGTKYTQIKYYKTNKNF